MTAHAASGDGITWHKPKLGIIDFDGSTVNNLVWKGQAVNLAPFRDDNPDAKSEERYKAVARTRVLRKRNCFRGALQARWSHRRPCPGWPDATLAGCHSRIATNDALK